MILLESHNVIIQTTLADKAVKPSSLDVLFVDFDGVRFHLSTPDQKTVVQLSMNIRCWDELVVYGALDILRREYGTLIKAQTEPEYHISLDIDLEQLPGDEARRDAFIKSIALLKRNALAAPFELAFRQQKELETSGGSLGDLMQIHYRDEEGIYIRASPDRVTVIFSTIFREETDRTFGKVFLQEFVDARRQPSIQNAPQVLYTNRDPPLEIRDVPGLRNSEDIGYVTFVLFPRHFAKPDVSYNTISHIQLFRDYLHYHIKCCKAYMHSRMRHRVAEFQKILNRAKTEVAATERKTVTPGQLVLWTESMDVERVTELAAAPSEEPGIPDSIRITRHGKLRIWIKKALDFFESHPSRPLVLYSAPADVSASTIARLVSIVEIIKREYLKGRDVSAGDVSGLHQYNQLLFEQQGRIPEEGEDRRDALHHALNGHSHAKQSFAPHMKITLSTRALTRSHEKRETHQKPATRRMSKAAKARMRRRLRKQCEIVDEE
ncbi:Arp2/3 complex, 34 kd subunit p34-Arc-domain-containing protein [Butyriboletus roseoflavus]|nr:Arp2/3 complex, 34 kd subunit p34-Arc-domain-containing protein [Butyriboletus roseoflavus]